MPRETKHVLVSLDNHQQPERQPSAEESESDAQSLMSIRLIAAASCGKLDRVKDLVEKQGCSPSATDYDNRTAAHIAVCHMRLDVLAYLVERGANVNAKDRWGRTCLDDAMEIDAQDAIAFLKSKGATSGSPSNGASSKVGQHQDSSNDMDWLHLVQACAAGSTEVAGALITSRPIDVNGCDYDQRTALHLACCEGYLPLVELLMDHGANPHTRDRWGNTPIAEAMKYGHDEIVQFLSELSNDASIDDEHARAEQAIQHAHFEDATVEMKLLHQRGIGERWALNFDEAHVDSEPFAEGSSGDMYYARWRKMKCVVKRLGKIDTGSQESLFRFGKQVSEFSHVRHPNLVMFLGACLTVDPPMFLLEYCGGGTLDSKLSDSRHSISKATKLRYCKELSLGMNCLHQCNPPILHLDLKPSNVLLTVDGHIKVADFALKYFVPAKNKHENDSFVPNPGEVTSTESYRFMAPELFKGAPSTRKADVYSFALIVYWIYTNRKPFAEYENGVEAVKQAAAGERPPLAALPPGLRDLLSKCWAAKPKERLGFPDIVEVLDEYERTRKSCTIS